MRNAVTIRAARADDYRDIYELFACPRVVRNTLQLPYVSLDKRKAQLQNSGADNYALVAEMGGKVVGSIDISRKRNCLAHVASIGMAVHDDYQNRGIGAELMKAALDMTDNWLNIRRVELDVYEGEYVDAYHMARLRE